MNNISCIIIPDVHGRTFWRDAVKGHENDPIIFLGDYLDPYDHEGITPNEAYNEFKDIIEFKKRHMDNVVLLLGNHDMGYLDTGINECRRDYPGSRRNKELILQNLDLFDLVHCIEVNEEKVLFSHAGISREWIESCPWLFDKENFRPEFLNELLHDTDKHQELFLALSYVSKMRGGYDCCGSAIWADIREFLQGCHFLEGYMHIFGHTLHSDGAYMVKTGNTEGYCLDCMEAFILNDAGELDFAI
ncbi:MAG: metallophosphoesterase [Bacteroidales bacterium]|nr:metallophosphoesterase [Bacteroidales bacterium]